MMEAVLDQGIIAEAILNRTNGAFGSKIGVFGKIFGCWHKQMTRPFTNRNASYRACLNCGARKKFDTKTLKTFGPFYYPPIVSFIEN
ncbi:MAG: hypothetical protein M3405_10625 [Acidobacteriota bacterium]|jgi:hypothetical protein|nr:hypothetical protein [Acidobacteriota bacterium]